jgi:organic radical activating enzyme
MKIPKQVIIETTSKCNLKCKLCPNTALGAKGEHMDYSLFKSIIDRIDFPTVVIPWMNGEPLMNPEFPKMLTYIEKKDLPYYVTTNGTIIRDDFEEVIFDQGSRCYQVIFSLDGLPFTGTPEAARPGTDIVVVRKNMYDFIKRAKKARPNLTVAVKLCQRGQDYAEIEDYIKYMLIQWGVDYVCIGRDLERLNPVSMRFAPCQYYDNNFMVIRANGDVVLCAYNYDAVNTDRFIMASAANDIPLLELYNNESFRTRRKDQDEGYFLPPCDSCGFAYNGNGFKGTLTSRGDWNALIYYHQDYYNQFFSLKQDWKNDRYYLPGVVYEAK